VHNAFCLFFYTPVKIKRIEKQIRGICTLAQKWPILSENIILHFRVRIGVSGNTFSVKRIFEQEC